MKERRIRSFPLAAVVAAAISALVLAGCPASSYDVRYQVEVTRSVSQEGVPEPAPSSSDGCVEVDWRIMSWVLVGVFSNPVNTEGKILWEGAVFSYGGESEPLISTDPHQTPDLPQPPTTIPPNGQVEVSALPLSSAKWRWFTDRSTGGFWYAGSPLIGIGLTREQSKEERQQLAETAIGQQFDVQIPIQLDDKILVHEFHFRIVGAEAYASYY